MSRAVRAGAAAGAALCAVYAATAAPRLTFWDAGEFIAAFATFGVPHPPGTPLFVALGRVWTLAFATAGVGAAPAAALLSAACTAAAGAVTAAMLARWTGSAVAGMAGALCAGGMSTAWANATEAEVYAPALLLSLLAVLAGDRAGRESAARPGPAGRRGASGTVAAAYALALAVPLHLGALVSAPAVAWLAAGQGAPRGSCTVASGAAGGGEEARSGRTRVWWPRVVTFASVTLVAAGVGSGRSVLALIGAAGFAVAARWPSGSPALRRAARGEASGALAATLIAVSALLLLLIRAGHDPWLNQGDPSTWPALADVVARRQYAPAPPWPRQAPWWLQLANLAEWADWQVALGLAPQAAPSWRRTPLTLVYAGLGTVGAAWHRRRDRRSFGAWALLLACGSVGVAAYLNLKAGPSFGAGVLPGHAPHEARERDYFFVLAWWAWGAWAGLGAAVLARRIGRAHGVRLAAALGTAALPIALNWPAVSRRHAPEVSTADAYARALLRAAPPNAVLLVHADNDSYPLWALQAAEGLRRDVTPVTLALLPARWYRTELARRHSLLPPTAARAGSGDPSLHRALADAARAHGRPLVATLAVDPDVRASVPGVWMLTGLLVEHADAGVAARRPIVATPPALAARAGAAWADTAAVRRHARLVTEVAPGLFDVPARVGGDGVGPWARRQLACPAALLAAASHRASAPVMMEAARLEGACGAR